MQDKIVDIIEKKKSQIRSYHFKNKDAVDRKLNLLAYEEIESSQDPEALAYVTRQNSSAFYEKYVTNEVPEAYEALDMHESGHLVLQHLRYIDKNMNAISIRFKAKWPILKKYIDFEIPKDSKRTEPTFEEIKETQTALLHQFANIAQDFQVNTSIIEPDEEDKLRTAVETVTLTRALRERKTDDLKEYLSCLAEAKKEGKPEPRFGGTGCFPKDYGFPDKESWLIYIDLMLNQPDKFMKSLSSNAAYAVLSTNSNGKIRSSDITSGKLAESVSGKGMLDTIAKADSSENAKSKGNGSRKILIKNEEICTIKQAEKFIVKNATAREKEQSYQDPVYNYNRRKTGSILIPKSRDRAQYRINDVYILVDCSGSVANETVGKMLRVCKSISSKVGKKSKVFYWDTELLEERRLAESSDIPCGGGTNISEGIRYIKRIAGRNRNVKLFVVSDFYDNLLDWDKELKKWPGDAYGIRWHYEDDKDDKSYIVPSFKKQISIELKD